MGAITIATGAVTAYVACRLWPRGGRAYVAAVLFPVGVALIGTIVINRYDVAVALLIADLPPVPRRALVHGGRVRARHGLRAQAHAAGAAAAGAAAGRAAAALGLAAGRLRRRGRRAVPALPGRIGTSGVWHVFQYHLERPLQIESVLGTPQLLGQLLGADWATWAWSHGSHSLVAPGVGLAADLSGGLTLLAVAAVYLFAWLRRRHLRAAPADQALVVLALLLALMTFGKVLSPQYFIWILPAWALVAATRPLDRRPRRPDARAHPGRVPGALLEPARHAAGRRWRSWSRATRCCWRRSRSRCGGCGRCRETRSGLGSRTRLRGRRWRGAGELVALRHVELIDDVLARSPGSNDCSSAVRPRVGPFEPVRCSTRVLRRVSSTRAGLPTTTVPGGHVVDDDRRRRPTRAPRRSRRPAVSCCWRRYAPGGAPRLRQGSPGSAGSPRVRVVGEDDVGADEDVVLDGHELEEAAGVDAHAAADTVAELEHGVGADADVVTEARCPRGCSRPARSAGGRRWCCRRRWS